MTVAELIAELQNMPQDAWVLLMEDSEAYTPACSVRSDWECDYGNIVYIS